MASRRSKQSANKMGFLTRFLQRFSEPFRADPVRAKKIRSRIWFSLRLLVSAALVLWLILEFDWGETWQALTRISAWGIAVLVLGLLLNRLVAFTRFWVLLKIEKMPLSLGTVMRVSFLATFASNFLPTSVGGDLAKIGWLASRPEVRTGTAQITIPALRMAFWTLFDRLSNMLAIGLLAPFCLLLPFLRAAISRWLGGWAPDFFSVMLIFIALTAAAGLALGVGAEQRAAGKPAGAGLPAPDQAASDLTPVGTFKKAVFLFKKLLSRRRTFGLLVLISMISMAPNLLATWWAARDLGMQVDLWAVTAVYVILYFVALLPVSINGLGIQEISTVALYSSLGATQPQAAALAILLRFAIWITTLPGAFWLTRGIPSQPAAGQELSARQPAEPGPNPGAD